VVEVLEPQAGQQLLEVGPGPGYHTFAVAERLTPGGQLHVFDIQQEMLDALMQRAARREVDNVVPRQGDARKLPYADESFDGALLVTVLGEIPDQELALRELQRVIRPGGRLVVGETPALDPHFVRHPVLRRRAEAAGFRFERREGPGLAFLARFRRD
jgi:ubiquinone/menaquinone biosynthesis C-methylase UbiE